MGWIQHGAHDGNGGTVTTGTVVAVAQMMVKAVAFVAGMTVVGQAEARLVASR